MTGTNLEPPQYRLRKRTSSIAIREQSESKKSAKIETEGVKLIPDVKEEDDMDECVKELKEIILFKKEKKERKITEDVKSGRWVRNSLLEELEGANTTAKAKCISCGVLTAGVDCGCRSDAVENWLSERKQRRVPKEGSA
jgi:hypothetical protein